VERHHLPGFEVSGPHVAVGFGHAARGSEQECKGKISRCIGEDARRIGCVDATLLRRRDINIVVADRNIRDDF
jgi:hypothetical protein